VLIPAPRCFAWNAECICEILRAMPEQNLKLWGRSTEAWNRGDREAWLADITPSWEFHTSGVFPGTRPVYRGREGAAELWETMREPWDHFEVAVDRIEDLGDRLVSLVTFRVQGRDGLEASRQWAYLVRFEGGLLARTDNFESWEMALEAAGLRQSA
jgi:ketosteroid isomerase-like protein